MDKIGASMNDEVDDDINMPNEYIPLTEEKDEQDLTDETIDEQNLICEKIDESTSEDKGSVLISDDKDEPTASDENKNNQIPEEKSALIADEKDEQKADNEKEEQKVETDELEDELETDEKIRHHSCYGLPMMRSYLVFLLKLYILSIRLKKVSIL